jgi:hypothetical protein
MRNELLQVIRRGLEELHRDPSRMNLVTVISRMGPLASHLRHLRVTRTWISQLEACDTGLEIRLCCEKILKEITKILNPNPSAVEYIQDNLLVHTGLGTEDIVRKLDNAVRLGAAFSREPPWTREQQLVQASPDIVICVSREECNRSTERLLDDFRTEFQSILNDGLPRPKLWILPTVSRRRVLIAMGNPDVVERLLSRNSF